MKIILNEKKLVPLMLNEIIREYNISDGNADHNPYKKKIDNATETLKNLVKTQGIPMLNINNGRQYLVFEIIALAELVGKRYGICQIIKDNEAHGTISIKPMVSFKPIY